MNNFKEMFECKFEVSEEDIKLAELAKFYHDTCEAYDESVCSGRSKYDGCAMPTNRHELELINRNASNVLKSIYENNPDINPSDIKKAIRNVR